MDKQANCKPVLIIPCSGIGKVHGLITREAAYLVTDELASGLADTLCLGLLVKRDDDAVSAIKTQRCITVDGCPKACAEKCVVMAGGQVDCSIQVAEAIKKHRGAKPGTATDLTEEGWLITGEVAQTVANEVARLDGSKEVL
jgi:uncharacterized metal-binding protein